MNQSVVEQMDQALAGDGMDRLVDRTRVWRGDDTARLGVTQPADETASRPTDVNVFDDSDFYAQLLRDLIDNASIVEGAFGITDHSRHICHRFRRASVTKTQAER